MRLFKIYLNYFLFVSLAVACEQDDVIPVHNFTLSSQQLKEIIPSPRLRAAPLSPRSDAFYTFSKIEEIYGTLQKHGYSRLETLRSLRKNNQNDTIFLIPTVNRLLQKHLNNMYSENDKTILLRFIPKNINNDINSLKRLIIETNFDYRRASDIAFQLWGPYKDRDECITTTNIYGSHLDFLLAEFAQSKIVLTEEAKENIFFDNF